MSRTVEVLKAQNAARDRSVASRADQSEVESLKADNTKDQEMKQLKEKLDKIEKMLNSK